MALPPIRPAEEIEAALATRSFKHFVRVAWNKIDPAPLVWNWHVEAICDHLQAVAEGRIQKLIINVPPGHAKPCDVNGMVLEKTRGRIRLDDVVSGDFVLTHMGRFRRVTAVHAQGTLGVLKISTHSGREIVVAPDHPLLTARGWIQAQHLTADDVLAEVHKTESAGTATVSAEESRLLGYLVGDGSVKYSGKGFTNQDPDTITDFRACAAAVGLATSEPKQRTGKAFYVSLKSHDHSDAVSVFLGKHGLNGADSYTKRVPRAIAAGDETVIRNFLGAYWACDGYIRPRGYNSARGKDSCAIGCDSVSKNLMGDIQHLLNRLGISSNLRTKRANLKTKRQGDVYVSYSLSISRFDMGTKFCSLISIVHEKARRMLNFDIRTGFDRVLNEDPIVSVTPHGTAVCKCLTVDEDSSFVYQDVAVHNSMLTSVLWPAWVWIRRPEWQVISASYELSLVTRDAVKARELMRSDWYQKYFRGGKSPFSNCKKWDFTDDQDQKTFYSNSSGGFRVALSVGGKGTGYRGSTIFIDDPLKAGDAHSKLARENVIRWKTETMATRFNDPTTASEVLIMQRLHEDDLTGYLLRQGGWQHLCLASEFDPDKRSKTYTKNGLLFWEDPRNEKGELLFPQKFTPKVLEDLKSGRGMGSYAYAGQHQQNPVPADGGLIKREWFNRRYVLPGGHKREGLEVRELPKQFDSYTAWVDATFKKTDDSDRVAIGVIGQKGPDLYLLELVWKQMGFVETVQALVDVRNRWRRLSGIYIEDKANGSAIIDTLKTKMPGIIGVEPDGGKESRIAAASPFIEAGNFWLPQDALWVDDFILEATSFPKAPHDDAIDMVAYALLELCGRSSTTFLEAMGAL